MMAFPAGIFLGAFLLFLVEPLIGKQILPWFGGAPAVWSTCLVFFQVGLIAGYGYAHLGRRLGIRRQAALHALLLVGVLLSLPILPSPAWKPSDASWPALRVLVVLSVSVGAPYVLLSATAPMLQDWYAHVGGRRVFRLYALSNLASLLALLTYPTLVERHLDMGSQALWWSAGFVAFAVVCAWCGWIATRRAAVPEPPPEPTAPHQAVRVADRLLWLGLSACGAALLLSTTNQLCQDVATVPLLWIIPLALYLLTFVLAFAGWYRRAVTGVVFIAALAATTYALGHATTTSIFVQGTSLLLVLASGCLICHGELARLQPHVSTLTAYYLAIAIGGAIGGILVALVAPVVFTSYAELPLSMLAVLVLLVASRVRDLGPGRARRLPALVWGVPTVVFLVAAGIAITRNGSTSSTRLATRDFYGVLRVVDDDASIRHPLRGLYHGRVLHGAQFLEADRRDIATTYFVRGSGIEQALDAHPRRIGGRPLKVGVVGLGAGTIAIWGRPGDTFRFFELNPEVVRVAQDYFTFLRDSPATSETVTGDARLSLEREMTAEANRHTYDVIAVDAFSGDSIPVHLLTRECFAIYAQALTSNGVLAIHVTNQFLDLRPVVRGLASELGWPSFEIDRAGDPELAAQPSVWMLATPNPAMQSRLLEASRQPHAAEGPPRVWTDSYSSLAAVLR